jgi:hypothetical protein
MNFDFMLCKGCKNWIGSSPAGTGEERNGRILRAQSAPANSSISSQKESFEERLRGEGIVVFIERAYEEREGTDATQGCGEEKRLKISDATVGAPALISFSLMLCDPEPSEEKIEVLIENFEVKEYFARCTVAVSLPGRPERGDSVMLGFIDEHDRTSTARGLKILQVGCLKTDSLFKSPTLCLLADRCMPNKPVYLIKTASSGHI